MSTRISKPPVIFVVGPTASGKSALALEIAKALNGTVVNGDSLQVYNSLNVGTAKPTVDEMNLCPHQLFGHIEDAVRYTAGDFRKEALELFRSQSQAAPWVVVGGSGFYLQALEKGMFEVPDVPEEVRQLWQARIEEQGLEANYRLLESKDRQWAEKIQPEDSYRILRALSVMDVAGRSMSEMQTEFEQSPSGLKESFQVLKVGITIDRELLRTRVEKRLHLMLETGFVDEVKGLLSRGLREWAPMSSVGYKEMLQWLDGDLTEEERDAEIVKNTMRLAKRQRTWFQRDPEIQWWPFPVDSDEVIRWLTEQIPSN